MRNQPIQPKEDTRDYSVFKPAQTDPLPTPEVNTVPPEKAVSAPKSKSKDSTPKI